MNYIYKDGKVIGYEANGRDFYYNEPLSNL